MFLSWDSKTNWFEFELSLRSKAIEFPHLDDDASYAKVIAYAYCASGSLTRVVRFCQKFSYSNEKIKLNHTFG